MTKHAENQCNLLDDYLSGEMSADGVVKFEKHIEGCAACRSEIDQWSVMSQSLKVATHELETPNLRLIEEVEKVHLQRKQSGRRRIVYRCVAAVVVACLLLTFRLVEFEPSTPTDKKLENVVASPLKIQTVDPIQGVQFPDNFIGVPIDIEDENVTVVWVYPIAK